MSQQSKSTLQSAINTQLADNTSGNISAANVRDNLINMTDSLLFNNETTQTLTGALTVTGGITGSLQGTATSASYAATASVLLGGVISASYAATASIANVATKISTTNLGGSGTYYPLIASSLSGEVNLYSVPNAYKYDLGIDQLIISSVSASAGFTGSLQGTATSSSFAISASRAVSASFASTASYIPVAQTLVDANLPLVLINGNSLVKDQYESIVYNPLNNLLTVVANTDFSGPITSVSSISSTGGFTGSLQGTASYAVQALSASWAPSTGGSTFPYNGAAQITGSLSINGFLANGDQVTAAGSYSHAEGQNARAAGNYSHAEGRSTTSSGQWSHTEGFGTISSGSYSHAEGNGTISFGQFSHAEGLSTMSSGSSSHAEGIYSTSSGIWSHAEGYSTISSGQASHTEGYQTIALGDYSHAEGQQTISSGSYSHAEGDNTQAIGPGSHAEGTYSIANGDYSHAEGNSTEAIGQNSHAEGQYSIAIGNGSHAEGNTTNAVGPFSHAEGVGTIASGSFQHVSGRYNTQGDNTSLFIIGNGDIGTEARSDAFKVRMSGSIVLPTTASGTPGWTGTNGEMIPGDDGAGNYVLWVYLGGNWLTSSLGI